MSSKGLMIGSLSLGDGCWDAMLPCDAIPLRGSIYGRSPVMADVRRSLQGYSRCFKSQEYFRYQRLAEAVVFAEIFFDSPQVQIRQRCAMGAASLGLLLCLNLFPWHAVVEMVQKASFESFEDSGERIAAKEVLA